MPYSTFNRRFKADCPRCSRQWQQGIILCKNCEKGTVWGRMQNNLRSFGCNNCGYDTGMHTCPDCRAFIAYEWIELRYHPFLRWAGACVGCIPLAAAGMAVMNLTTNSAIFSIGGFVITYVGLLVWFAKART